MPTNWSQPNPAMAASQGYLRRRRRPGQGPNQANTPGQANQDRLRQWRRRNQGGGGGGGGLGGAPPLPPQPQPPAGQALPLSGEQEAGQRSLSDQLTAVLARIAAARGQVQPMADLSLARMATNEGLDLRGVDENAAARGIFNSGVQRENRGLVQTGYGRQRQDLNLGVAGQLSDLAAQESGAQLAYQQGLADLLLQIAQGQAGDESLDVMGTAPYELAAAPPEQGPGGGMANRRRRNRGRGRPQGGGQGGRPGGRRRR